MTSPDARARQAERALTRAERIEQIDQTSALLLSRQMAKLCEGKTIVDALEIGTFAVATTISAATGPLTPEGRVAYAELVKDTFLGALEAMAAGREQAAASKPN